MAVMNRGFQLFQITATGEYVWLPPNYIRHAVYGPTLTPAYNGEQNLAVNPLPTSTTGYTGNDSTLSMTETALRSTATSGSTMSWAYNTNYPAVPINQPVNYQVTVSNPNETIIWSAIRAYGLDSSNTIQESSFASTIWYELNPGDTRVLNLRYTFTNVNTVKAAMYVFNSSTSDGGGSTTAGQMLDMSNFSIVKNPMEGPVPFWVGTAKAPDIPRYPY